MGSPTPNRVQWTLMVERLMDADLLLPEEGNALLREITDWSPRPDSPEPRRVQAERLTQALEAIGHADSLDASERQALLETVSSLVRHPAD
jgi:hypothetical protein